MNNDEPKKKRGYSSVGGGIYVDNRTGKFYHRPTINGKPTFRLLDVQTLTLARKLKGKLDTNQTMFENGMEKDPYGAAPVSVGELIEGYIKENCPLKSHQSRDGKQLAQELSRLNFVKPFWQHRQADQVKPKDCAAYFAARRGTVRAGCTGGRAVDMELSTLTAVFNWAVFSGKLDVNPLANRPKFRDGKTVKHCRNFMPKDAAELHNLARALFEDPRSEALGWQLLLEAMTGCRTSEILRLRWDAKEMEAGHIDASHLWLARCKDGINPFVEIHPALAQTLEALRRWRVWREMTDSPWFVPSYRNPGHAVESASLTHALKRVAPLISKAHRTSHGLRAYYVTVRRSMGISDAQIAAEIGDATGAAIISSTYGSVPTNWRGGAVMGWAVEEPAWSALDMPGNVVELQSAIGG